jgi:cytochrome c-type biogenesis protein CcmF
MPLDVPTLGTFVLYAALIACGYTFAVSLAAAGGRPRMLRSARMGTFATVALVACAVFLLAYAFQTHDFRIRYVARYSDRSMPAIYLWTSLWGGQDGSLLWWSFLLSGYTAAFTWWIGDRYRELQPYIFATLMTVFAFFFVLMLFAANPFATTFGPPPPDGEGLNPLLQNYWMVIHPPSLYMGLTGWAIPFAFVVAALITGRLGNEWILASRRWVLVAWGFLSLGNMLGMFWSYEELGWGGYWAWDPVENASFMPWLTATAYLHSVMIQERKGMLKVWNVFLLIWTFILTIFGTFLTRSGLIASVHSFARSDIGVYFAWYLVLLVAATTLLVAYRIPDLRYGWRIGSTEFAVAAGFGFVSALVLFVTGTEFDILLFAGAALLPAGLVGVVKLVEVLRLDVWKQPARVEGKRRIVESLLSREFAFLFNNWILIGMLGFVMISTTFPLLSEALRGETVTVGPEFYNQWMVPLGVILLFLMGVGPAISWRKATGKNLLQAFRLPALAGVVCAIGHVVGGSAAGFPAYVEVQPMYDTGIGDWLAFITGFSPVVCTSIAAFTMGTVLQEYWRGVRVRMKNKGEDPLTALVQLVSRARRRYGGYLVHAGIVLMYVGFTGAAYDTEREGALRPGQSLEVGAYELRYEGAIPEEDVNKRAVYGHLTLFRGRLRDRVGLPGQVHLPEPPGDAHDRGRLPARALPRSVHHHGRLGPGERAGDLPGHPATPRLLDLVRWAAAPPRHLRGHRADAEGGPRRTDELSTGPPAPRGGGRGDAALRPLLRGSGPRARARPGAGGGLEHPPRRVGGDPRPGGATALRAAALRVRRLPAAAPEHLRLQLGRRDAGRAARPDGSQRAHGRDHRGLPRALRERGHLRAE